MISVMITFMQLPNNSYTLYQLHWLCNMIKIIQIKHILLILIHILNVGFLLRKKYVLGREQKKEKETCKTTNLHTHTFFMMNNRFNERPWFIFFLLTCWLIYLFLDPADTILLHNEATVGK